MLFVIPFTGVGFLGRPEDKPDEQCGNNTANDERRNQVDLPFRCGCYFIIPNCSAKVKASIS
jgi:hypothetical protein